MKSNDKNGGCCNDCINLAIGPACNDPQCPCHSPTKDNLIEDLVIDFWNRWPDASTHPNSNGIGYWLREALTKTEASEWGEGYKQGIEEVTEEIRPHIEASRQEGRAEFAKTLLKKMDILLANYSDDRRVPPAQIRRLLESELKRL